MNRGIIFTGLHHQKYGYVHLTGNSEIFTDVNGVRWARFLDRINTWVALPLSEVMIHAL